MNNGNTEIITREIGRNWIDLMGISKTKWKGIGQVKSDDYTMYFNGKDKIERKGVAKKNKKMCTWVQSYK